MLATLLTDEPSPARWRKTQDILMSQLWNSSMLVPPSDWVINGHCSSFMKISFRLHDCGVRTETETCSGEERRLPTRKKTGWRSTVQATMHRTRGSGTGQRSTVGLYWGMRPVYLNLQIEHVKMLRLLQTHKNAKSTSDCRRRVKSRSRMIAEKSEKYPLVLECLFTISTT